MSLRDFNNAPFSDDPTALHTVPSGNGGGLESFHTTQPEDIEPNNMPKIIGAVAVALMVGVAGVALYAHSGNQPKPVAAASNLPPAQPAPAQQTAMAPDANTPATTPAAEAPAMTPAEQTPAPVKSASIAKKHVASSAKTKSSESTSADSSSAAATRLSADSSQSTVQPQQQQAVTPQPSPSDVATNNTQSGVAVPPGANTASDIPAAPQALQQPAPAANPAPEQQPAPAQPQAAQ